MAITEAGFGLGFTAEDWSQFVLDHLYLDSVLFASGATRIVSAKKQVHVPRVLTDGNAVWPGEGNAITSTDPTADEMILTFQKVAKLVTMSNESIDDSEEDVLRAVALAAIRAVALEADKQLFAGDGLSNKPLGITKVSSIPTVSPAASVDYAGLVKAAGLIRAAGGNPDVAFINPVDFTALELALDGANRPLYQSANDGPAERIAGLRPYVTAAMPSGKALVAQADQIVVGVRNDPTLKVSNDAAFTSDSAVARVIARVDAAVNDLNGLALTAALA